MAEFEVKVYRLEIEEHPNADALELARVGDYRTVVQKGLYKTGDLGVYIPEAAVLPEWLIKEMGLEGRLAGKDKNRVKAIKLRGILSQGLVYPIKTIVDETTGNTINWMPFCTVNKQEEGFMVLRPVKEGDEVSLFLSIEKYEPPIPVHMSGEVFNAFGKTIHYDIENIKKYPDVLVEGEEVVITEKIHGTWCCFGYHPEVRESHIITSKGLSAKGLAFKVNENNTKNLYIRALDGTAPYPDGTGGNIMDRLRDYMSTVFSTVFDTPVYLLGEVYGKGVQDLAYGAQQPQFRVFDIYVGEPGKGWYLGYEPLRKVCVDLKIDRVPTLYVGPYSKEIVDDYTIGAESVSGKVTHMREGIVIAPTTERRDPLLGRVKLKSISEKYLLRKGNTTEYQ